MATPSELVTTSFAQAQDYAAIAQSSLTGFTAALNAAIYSPPTISVVWNSIATPSLPSLPSVPTMPTITYNAPTAVADFIDVAPTAQALDSFDLNPPLVSDLITGLSADLKSMVSYRMAHSTGLSVDVEAAIWARARDRATALALANEDDIARTSEAMGFMMPAGVMVDQLRMAQQHYYDEVSELSRDIAIKQAELEQKNNTDTLTVGNALNGELINVYKTTADAYGILTSAKAEYSKLGMSRYESLIRAYEASVSAYKTKVDAERSRIEALTAQSTTMLDGYKAGAQALEATASMYSRLYETQIKDYEAGQQIVIQAAKINADNVNFANSTRTDAAKAGAQVYAQLVSSAYSMIHASAGVSAGAQMGVNYSYSNDTTSTVSPITSV
jgi:hypothetical protein